MNESSQLSWPANHAPPRRSGPGDSRAHLASSSVPSAGNCCPVAAQAPMASTMPVSPGFRPRDESLNMFSCRAQNLLAMLLAVFAIAVSATAARAETLDGLLEVRSAYVSVEQDTLQLFARVSYPVNDDIRAALKDG